MNINKVLNRTITAVTMGLILPLSANAGLMLVGVTGDGATTPETLFELNPTNASQTFIMSLGNGNDGETIGFNPDDGLLYHASGISDGDRFWESIDVSNAMIVSSNQFTGSNVDDEQLAMTYNPATGSFLVVDRADEFFDTTLGGVATDIGEVEDNLKGLAFVGGTLYGGEVFGPLLHSLNPLTGATLTTVGVTLTGFGTVRGINGLSTHPGTEVLWGIVAEDNGGGGFPGTRHLATIDPTTGVATSVGILGDNFAGIAWVETNVPEPSSLALLALGILGLGVRRRGSH